MPIILMVPESETDKWQSVFDILNMSNPDEKQSLDLLNKDLSNFNLCLKFLGVGVAISTSFSGLWNR